MIPSRHSFIRLAVTTAVLALPMIGAAHAQHMHHGPHQHPDPTVRDHRALDVKVAPAGAASVAGNTVVRDHRTAAEPAAPKGGRSK